METDDEFLWRVLNEEILRELLLEKGIEISDEEIKTYIEKCSNPMNAFIIHMTKLENNGSLV